MSILEASSVSFVCVCVGGGLFKRGMSYICAANASARVSFFRVVCFCGPGIERLSTNVYRT